MPVGIRNCGFKAVRVDEVFAAKSILNSWYNERVGEREYSSFRGKHLFS
jgi:hypothetical protein